MFEFVRYYVIKHIETNSVYEGRWASKAEAADWLAMRDEFGDRNDWMIDRQTFIASFI